MTQSNRNTSIPAQNGDSRDTWIEELQNRLLHLERLASVGELTSTTTHEFNNLLMTVINYARMGLKNKDEAARDKAFTRILDAANRGAKITSMVLGLARSRPADKEPTDLIALVEDALVLMERELQKYRILVEKNWKTAPKISASPDQIQRLLLNLLTNARQAIGESGLIKIKIAHETSSNSVVLSVRDSGCGIEKDVLPRIFKPFFTTKSGPDSSGKGGTGLGLSACKEIVENHNGRIRVESTVGKGTAFSIKFPALQNNQETNSPETDSVLKAS
ncbi:MAG: ATP-binding protein [Pirellula sp.]|jgi:signal transduction histidine kinase|nr:ATP-binding protein [Pirellula sp.]